MVAVSPVPIVLGLVVGLGLFAWSTYFLIKEDAHHPVRWEPVTAHTGPHLSHLRVMAIGVVFILWSLWATARPVSGWR
jgi:hypothetical protein